MNANSPHAVTQWIPRILIVLAIAVTGCVPITCQHPLSDDETSSFDERLVGYWLLLNEQGVPVGPEQQFVVGRVADKPNVQEVVFTRLENQQIEIKRHLLYCTQIDGRRYLSLEGDASQPGFSIAEYEVSSENGDTILSIFGLDVAFIAKSVEERQLAGIVKRKYDGNVESISITSPPADVAAFLSHNREAVLVDSPLRLRRAPTAQ